MTLKGQPHHGTKKVNIPCCICGKNIPLLPSTYKQRVKRYGNDLCCGRPCAIIKRARTIAAKKAAALGQGLTGIRARTWAQGNSLVITIPSEFREAMNLQERDPVMLTMRGEQLCIEKA